MSTPQEHAREGLVRSAGPGGLAALRRALAAVLAVDAPGRLVAVPAGSVPGLPGGHVPPPRGGTPSAGRLLAQASGPRRADAPEVGDRSGAGGSASPDPEGREDDSAYAASSLEDRAEGQRLIALVELARGGDAEAFGLLYDHYQPSVYRFLYYRVGSVQLAEDLTADTFFRALRSMSTFRWQGKDFGAWLMTIARNLATDHFKAGRTRLETTTEDMSDLDTTAEGPEGAVLASLTNEALLEALRELPTEQRDCLVMRFLQGMSIAETAEVLDRSPGAVKQLQLRGVRNLAKLLPEGVR